MPARRYAHALYGTHPVGEWRRAGLLPPMWLDREFERAAMGNAESIYARPAPPPRRYPPLLSGIHAALATLRAGPCPF
ncbi:hypothetical protein VQ02_33490 [Methylobacterium variabile]|uniref:Uncharacterized protein n=1 Tax=Methylobacterium variabile TaxID=298794 RepID=A0A0J6RWN8_9HYPH|nr:hypothetical protein [Methylobacterium variabile]KMO27265.1 hypothetical protein VQ02_33490 [Methylobacterium variabile]